MSERTLNGQHFRIRPEFRWLSGAVVLSIGAHLALLFFLPALDTPGKSPGPGIEISLLEPLPTLAPEPLPAESIIEAEPALPQPESEQQQDHEAKTQPTEPQSTEPNELRNLAATIAAQESSQSEPLDSLAILEAVREAHRPTQAPSSERAAIPRLPDQPGWLNDHVGTVRAGRDSWHLPDGSQRARLVTRSGDIWCGQNDPPPISDVFNPQFSVNVMRWRKCGRERPAPVDRTDPWLRAPGGG